MPSFVFWLNASLGGGIPQRAIRESPLHFVFFKYIFIAQDCIMELFRNYFDFISININIFYV